MHMYMYMHMYLYNFIYLFIYLYLFILYKHAYDCVCVCVWVYGNRCVYYLPLIPTGKFIQLNVSYVSFAKFCFPKHWWKRNISAHSQRSVHISGLSKREPLGYQNGRREIDCKPLDLRGPNFETHLGLPQAVPRHLRPLSTFHFAQWKSGATLSRYNL